MKQWLNGLLFVLVGMILSAAFIMVWQSRSYRTNPAASAARTDTITMSDLYAGGKPNLMLSADDPNTHEGLSSYDVSEGKRLFTWFNCSTCHAEGGGDIGPPLMDDKWLYGSAPRNIFASILEGRPNGMPSFRGKIPDAQVWQLVAYIRSMGAKTPFYTPSSRNDDLQTKPAETLAPDEPTKHMQTPSPDNRSNIK